MECAFLLVVVVLASLVHSVWALIRYLVTSPTPTQPPAWESCVGCGRTLDLSGGLCRACQLDPFSPRAIQLRQLEAGAALLQNLHQGNHLDSDTCERVYRCIESRQLALLREPAPPTQSAVPLEDLSTRQVDRALATCSDLRRLPFAHRRQALAWFARSFDDTPQLSLTALTRLAELLEAEGQTHDALTVYRRLVERSRPGPARGQAALAGGRLAHRLEIMNDWAWFVGQASTEPLGPLQRQELGQLQRQMMPAPAPVARIVPLAIPVAAPAPPKTEPLPPAPPPRSFAEMLGGFMEERNILWGELVGGMLIVGCSIALVISLWRTLEQIPFFPFLVVALLTAGIFGAGFYTLSHWKLESTSRGLLVIAILLLPLNFVVLAGLPGPEGAGWVELPVGLGVLAGFGWLVRRASAVLFDPALSPTGVRTRGALPVAVLGCALGVLLVPRVTATSDAGLLLLTMLPTLCVAGSMGRLLVRLSRAPQFTPRQAGALFVFLGTAGFAAAVAIGFLAHSVDDAARVLPFVAVAAAVLGVPVLFGGLLTLGTLERETATPVETTFEVPRSLLQRLAEVTVLAGMAVQGVAICAAWPNVVALWLTCLLNCAALLFAAWHYRRPQGYPLALLCLTIGYLTLVQGGVGAMASGDSPGMRLLTALISPGSGVALAPLAIALAGAAEFLTRRGRSTDASIVVAGAAALGFAALLLVLPESAHRPGRVLVVQMCVAAACLGFNARWRRPAVTGSAAILFASVVLLALAPFWKSMPASWLLPLTLLGQASAALGLAVAIRRASSQDAIESVYVKPLCRTATAASMLAAVLLASLAEWATLAPLAACVGWLSVLWLIVGLVRRVRILVPVAQGTGSIAVLLGVTALLRVQGWVPDDAAALFTPHSLQAYGVALAGFALLAALGRMRVRPHTSLAFDEVLRDSLIVGQLALAAWGLAPAVHRELLDGAGELSPGVFSSDAWWLFAALAALLVPEWMRGRRDRVAFLGVFGMLPLPLLVAGGVSERPVVSTLCWGLSLFFLLGVALTWVLQRWAAGGSGAERASDPVLRRCLLGVGAVPVLVLAAMAAGRCFAEPRAVFFEGPGVLVALVFPVALIGAGMVGHALRQRLPGYVFAAGGLAGFCVAGGYLLHSRGIGAVDTAVLVATLQLATGTGAVWTLLWVGGRTTGAGWRACVDTPPAEVLLFAQSALVGIGHALLLLAGLTVLMGRHVAGNAGYPEAMPLTLNVGTPLGWVVFILSVLAYEAFSRLRRVECGPPSLGFIAPGLLVLLACSAEHMGAGWGYRTFLIGSAVLAGYGAWRARNVAQRNVHLFWTRLAGAVLAAAALKAAYAHADAGWAAAALLLFAAAAVAWALRLRDHVGMFVAGGAANLAVFLLVHHACAEAPLLTWWVPLVQAEVLTASGLATLWLLLRPRLEAERSPWLDGYVAFAALTANAIVLMPVLFQVLWLPQGPMPTFVHQAGSVIGWGAFGMSAGAIVQQVRAAMRLHVIAILAVLLGCLATASATRVDAGGWLAAHVLTISWSLAGLAILTMGRRTARAGGARQGVTAWVVALSLLVVGLALRGAWNDPTRPYASCVAVLTAATLVGALAVWQRRAPLAYVSGLLPLAAGYVIWQAWLIDVVGVQTWLAWGPSVLDRFLFIETLCLAGSSLTWSMMQSRLRRTRGFAWHGSWPSFPCVAALLSMQVLVVLIGGGLLGDLLGESIHVAGFLAWSALAATALAFLLEYHAPERHTRRVALPALHLLGLLALALALHGAELALRRLIGLAAPALAAYALGTALLMRRDQRGHVCVRATQAFNVCTAFVLAGWIAVSYETWPERLIGPLTTAALAFGALRVRGIWRGPRPPLVLGLGLVTLAEAAGACFDPAGLAPWLNREAIFLTAVVVAGIIARGFESPEGAWSASLWRFSALCDGLAALLLPVLVAQEFLRYDPVARQAPVVGGSIVLVVLALIALMVKWIHAARESAMEPLGLTPRGRMAYVYAAEVILGLLLLHLRFCVPDIYPAFIGRHWTLITMALAYAAVGLGEVLARRGAWTIATPIRRTAVFLPLLPIAAFLGRPVALAWTPLGDTYPGLQPLLRMMERIPSSYLLHVTLWLLLAILYGGLGWLRRVPRYGLLAGLALTFGLWVIWANHEELCFTRHPQLWLIPLSLVVLAMEHLYRERLDPGGRGAIRNVGLLLLYGASAADLFITGVAHSVLLPVVLASLGVAGVLTGILLRVRAHLTFGAVFLGVAIFAEIWHAAVDRRQTWVWWACGIVLGAAILALFALFEKRRQAVLEVVAQIHQWE